MNCQIYGLNSTRKNQCKFPAQVRVTYPTGPEQYQLWALCLMHYIQCLKDDIKHLDEFPPGWVQEIHFIRSDDASQRLPD